MTLSGMAAGQVPYRAFPALTLLQVSHALEDDSRRQVTALAGLRRSAAVLEVRAGSTLLGGCVRCNQLPTRAECVLWQV